jgi:hypothetical protein
MAATDYKRRMWIEQTFKDLKSVLKWETYTAKFPAHRRLEKLVALSCLSYGFQLCLGTQVSVPPSEEKKTSLRFAFVIIDILIGFLNYMGNVSPEGPHDIAGYGNRTGVAGRLYNFIPHKSQRLMVQIVHKHQQYVRTGVCLVVLLLQKVLIFNSPFEIPTLQIVPFILD